MAWTCAFQHVARRGAMQQMSMTRPWCHGCSPVTPRSGGRSCAILSAPPRMKWRPSAGGSLSKAGACACSRLKTSMGSGAMLCTAPSGPRPRTHSCCCTGSACRQAIHRCRPAVGRCGTVRGYTTADGTARRSAADPGTARSTPRAGSDEHGLQLFGHPVQVRLLDDDGRRQPDRRPMCVLDKDSSRHQTLTHFPSGHQIRVHVDSGPQTS